MKRVKRIYPAYMITIIIQLLVGAHFSDRGYGYWTSLRTWKYVIFNLTFMNFVEPCLPGVFENNPVATEVNGALWTMKVEVGFYIILPMLLIIVKRLKSTKTRNAVLVGVYAISVLFVEYFNNVKTTGIIAHMGHQLPTYMCYFVAGILYVYNYHWLEQRKKCCFFPALAMVLVQVAYKDVYSLVFFPFSLMIVIMRIAMRKRNYQGGISYDYSYLIYLIHYPIIQILVSLGYFNMNQEVALIAVFCISFMYAICYKTIHQKVEENLMKI